ELEPVNLNFLIAESLSPFAETYPQITFQFIADNRLPQVFLDCEQMRRALINLLDNAINATRRGTAAETEAAAARISVKSSFHKGSDRVSIEVSDNGPGIPPEHRHRIFEPYFTTKKGGTGLGLAIVTSIISDHQGDIRIFGNQPHGTRFVIDLPIKPGSSTQRKFTAV
ncbi:MAG: GHKL domain-containing protein, partial [Deltaproteobacteria bacterium]|nr:GHKL domain-containing protein [Deltaproteobacteria bacterium]